MNSLSTLLKVPETTLAWIDRKHFTVKPKTKEEEVPTLNAKATGIN